MKFPSRAPILLAAAMGGTFLPGIVSVVAGNFAAALLLAYAFLGFSVIHGASRQLPARALILTAAWIAVFLLGWPLLLAALLGLGDGFIDLRARAARRGPPNPPARRPPNE
jgi:hypothetical protein